MQPVIFVMGTPDSFFLSRNKGRQATSAIGFRRVNRPPPELPALSVPAAQTVGVQPSRLYLAKSKLNPGLQPLAISHRKALPELPPANFLDGAPCANRRDFRMASPNYAGEKRRKDLAKQAKKKEKLAKKLEKSRETNSAPKSSDSEN